jgi:endonuclease/exonuclease/phosphatase family metal-dependent hydrolase
MKAKLTDYGSYGVIRSNDFSGEYSAIFYRKDRFEVLEQGSFWMSETPEVMSIGWDASTYRITSYLKLKDLKSEKELYHFNTHLDHKGSECSTESCKLLLNKIYPLNLPTVLTGDFNLIEGSDDYKILIEDKMSDSKFSAPIANSDTGGTTQGFGTKMDPLPIDFIFITKSFFKTNSYKIIRDKDENDNYPSDHFPIISEIEYI